MLIEQEEFECVLNRCIQSIINKQYKQTNKKVLQNQVNDYNIKNTTQIHEENISTLYSNKYD